MAEAKKTNEPKMVAVRIPKDPMDQRNYITVGINGVTYKIMRGKTVEVPENVAEMLQFAEGMSDEADEYKETLVKGTDGNGMTKVNY